MEGAKSDATAAVVNDATGTVHRHQIGAASLQTMCGLTNHVSRDQLRRTTIERATTTVNARKCGRCFEDAGGY